MCRSDFTKRGSGGCVGGRECLVFPWRVGYQQYEKVGEGIPSSRLMHCCSNQRMMVGRIECTDFTRALHQEKLRPLGSEHLLRFTKSGFFYHHEHLVHHCLFRKEVNDIVGSVKLGNHETHVHTRRMFPSHQYAGQCASGRKCNKDK